MTTTSSSMFSLWLLLPFIVLGIGAVLLWIALRGRKIDDHRVCRRCGYDLVGSPDSTACPECGVDLRRHRAVRIGNRTRSPWLVFAACALLLVGLVGGGVTLWTNSNGWERFKPVWLLRYEANVHGSVQSRRALDELVRRLQAGSLGRSQVDAVVGDALAVQANPAVTWDKRRGDFIETAHKAGQLSAADLEQYAMAALSSGITLEVRPRVRRGDRLPYHIVEGASRVGEKQGFYVRIEDNRIVIAGQVVSMRGGSSGYSLSSSGNGWTGSRVDLKDAALAAIDDGPVTVEFHAHAAVRLDSSSGPLIFEKDIVLTAMSEIVPADQQTATPTFDAAQRKAVTDALSIEELKMELKSDGRWELNIQVKIEPRPVDVAFAVFVRDAAGREWELNNISKPAAGSTTYHTGKWDIKGFDAAAVDVVLRPSRDAAAGTTDVFDYWDEQVVFPNVTVDWSAVPEDQRPVQSGDEPHQVRDDG